MAYALTNALFLYITYRAVHFGGLFALILLYSHVTMSLIFVVVFGAIVLSGRGILPANLVEVSAFRRGLSRLYDLVAIPMLLLNGFVISGTVILLGSLLCEYVWSYGSLEEVLENVDEA